MASTSEIKPRSAFPDRRGHHTSRPAPALQDRVGTSDPLLKTRDREPHQTSDSASVHQGTPKGHGQADKHGQCKNPSRPSKTNTTFKCKMPRRAYKANIHIMDQKLSGQYEADRDINNQIKSRQPNKPEHTKRQTMPKLFETRSAHSLTSSMPAFEIITGVVYRIQSRKPKTAPAHSISISMPTFRNRYNTPTSDPASRNEDRPAHHMSNPTSACRYLPSPWLCGGPPQLLCQNPHPQSEGSCKQA